MCRIIILKKNNKSVQDQLYNIISFNDKNICNICDVDNFASFRSTNKKLGMQ